MVCGKLENHLRGLFVDCLAEAVSALPLTVRAGLGAIAGAVVPLSFNPFNMWPLGMLGMALLYLCLQQTTAREAGRIGFAFGLGLFGVGASWIYVSIHDYGNASPFLAGLITLVFVAFMALYNGVQAWAWRRYVSALAPAVSFAASWVLCEVFRAWFLTGFPWLFLGYAHVTSPLSGVAPVFGVYGLSLLVALSGVWLAQLVLAVRSAPTKQRVAALVKTPALWALVAVQLAAFASTHIEWTHASQREPLRIGLVQGNIPQEVKFRAEAIQDGLDRYVELTAPLWQSDLVVWPETAIPLVMQSEPELMASLTAQATRNNAALITGVFSRSELGLHNSLVAVGNGSGEWHKQKLVPFGEYVPLRNVVENLLQLFDLPLSSLTPGAYEQPLLHVDDLTIAPYICYEVVYPDFARRVGRGADLLLTVSNDTWFGNSLGPPQHLQMAAMRARELGRYMVRATNNGISALIDPQGRVIAQTAQFQAETLQGSVLAFEGTTPFARWGSWPVWLYCLSVIGLNLWRRRSHY